MKQYLRQKKQEARERGRHLTVQEYRPYEDEYLVLDRRNQQEYVIKDKEGEEEQAYLKALLDAADTGTVKVRE